MITSMQSCKRMSVERLNYLDSEWELAKEQLSDCDNVSFHDEDKWIDICDENGDSCAQVSVVIDSFRLDGNTYENSFEPDALFVVTEWEVVDKEYDNCRPSPIDENVFIAWRTEFPDDTDEEENLCDSIVIAVSEALLDYERDGTLTSENVAVRTALNREVAGDGA